MRFDLRRSLIAMSMALPMGCANSTPGQAGQGADAKPAASQQDQPAVIKALEQQGLEIQGRFEAPSGLRGYAGSAGGRPISVYLTSDGKYALVGTLIDAQGNDVGAEALRKLVSGPAGQKMWEQLEHSTVVVDGQADAARIIYTFTDPNCPYCNAFWRASRPWVEAGKVQLRHVLVGIIKQDSPTKAAAILQASSPAQALAYNEEHHDQGGIKPAASVSPEVAKTLQQNLMLMTALGFQGTPAIVFKDAQGQVQTRSGMPQGADLENVLGPK